MQATKVIRFDHAPTEADLAALRAKGCTVLHVSRLAPEVTVRLPAEEPGQIRAMATELQALNGVTSLEDDFPIQAVLKDVAPLVQIAMLWEADVMAGRSVGVALAGQARGQGIRVAIIDTGIDPTFPGFAPMRIALVKDFSGEGPTPDGHGHGTHVAGIVGQTDAADAGYVGMAPECTYLIYKALTAQGSGSATGIAAAMEEALADGADVISMSLGGEAPSAEPDFLERRANLVGERIPVVVAAGNSGSKGGKPFRETPARAANVITVGASEKDDDVASFTSRGVTDDGRIKPNVYAPGHQIAAARAAGTTMGTPLSPHTTVASGTSMATPCISGIVAALLSHDPTLKGQPKVLKALLMTRGMPIEAEGPRVVAPSLLEQPYPSPTEGVDRTGETAPGPEPSPCEELILAALEDRDPARRRLAVRRAVAVARRELRRLTA